MTTADLARLWRSYADTGAGPDSPIHRAISHTVAADPALLGVVAAIPPDTHHPNHIFAAVRFLMLGGLDHALADAYAARDVDASTREFKEFVLAHREEIEDVLRTRRIQTNEVGRVAVIAPALRHVQRLVGGPLGLLDVGASAGLNLLVDEIGVDYGSFRSGPDVGCGLSCAVEGPLSPFAVDDLEIGWRMGLDRAPIDPADEQDARWLLSCVWIDQPDRIARLRVALEMARSRQRTIVTGDAVDGLADALNRIPRAVEPVVLTSWVMFYLPPDRRRAFEDALAHAGRPVWWVSLEHPGVVDIPRPSEQPDDEVTPSAIGLIRLGDGHPLRGFLGWAHPHGRRLRWQPPPTDDAWLLP